MPPKKQKPELEEPVYTWRVRWKHLEAGEKSPASGLIEYVGTEEDAKLEFWGFATFGLGKPPDPFKVIKIDHEFQPERFRCVMTRVVDGKEQKRWSLAEKDGFIVLVKEFEGPAPAVEHPKEFTSQLNLFDAPPPPTPKYDDPKGRKR